MKRILTFSVLVAGCTLGFSTQVVAQQAPVACAALHKMRQDYRAVNTALPVARTKKIIEEKPEFDAEETGCMGDWGVNIGIGLSSLASSFFDSMKDQACSAMNDYVDGQLAALTSSITAPLDLVGLDFSLGGSEPFSMEVSESTLGLDTGAIVDDVFDQAPNLTDQLGIDGYDGQLGNNPLGGRSLDDAYINQGRGQSIPAPNFKPQ